MKIKTLKPYLFPVLLMISIILGGLTGYIFNQQISWIKPLGDIFLNLILTTIIPLIFFSVASAVARASQLEKFSNILLSMLIVFVCTGMIASIYMLCVVTLFPPAHGIVMQLPMPDKVTTIHIASQFANIFTVTDFSKLLLHENILALIVFSIFAGLAASSAGDKGKLFTHFLQSGEVVFMRVFNFIMYYAPIGFFAYFAVMVSEIGPRIMQNYARIAVIYVVAAIIYYLCAYTLYAFIAGKLTGITLFWKNIMLPGLTAIATCSSAASIPANLSAAKSMRISPEIYETVIPLGTMIHKDGSILGGVIKIAFLFGIFHLDFTGASVLLTAMGISLLVGTVMGAIPSGGMLGEMLIISMYGFPPSVLVAIAAISIIIDPVATMLNVTGNSVSSMLVARMVDGKRWLLKES